MGLSKGRFLVAGIAFTKVYFSSEWMVDLIFERVLPGDQIRLVYLIFDPMTSEIDLTRSEMKNFSQSI